MNGTEVAVEAAEVERVARQLERTYCKQSRTNLYIACEDYDFTWDDAEVAAFRTMWREGTSLPRIAKALQRHVNEVFILALDQAEHKYISLRNGGLLGTEA